MFSIGEKLRDARLEHGLTVEDVALITKVQTRFLEAIEADRREELPSGFFFRNWALQYARALSVENQIIDELDRIAQSEAPLPLPGQEQRESKRSFPLHPMMQNRHSVTRLLLSFGLLLVVVLGCSGFYSWWTQQQQAPPASQASAPATPEAPRPVPKLQSIERHAIEGSRPTSPEAAAALSSDALLEIAATEPAWPSNSGDGKHALSGSLDTNQTEAKAQTRVKLRRSASRRRIRWKRSKQKSLGG